ncbi:MAG: hypothetical protein WBO45_00510, partial [Planctomycetota bacterium]
VLLLAVGLGVASSLVAIGLSRPTPATQRFLTWLEVERGRVECVVAGEVAVVVESGGGGATFVAEVGNQLRCAGASSFVLGTFGTLAAAPASLMEVRSMELMWKHGAVAASSLTLAVVAGVVTWHALGRSETAQAGEVLRMQAGAGGDPQALAAENKELRQRMGTMERELDELRAVQVQRNAAPPVAAPEPAVVEAPPPPPPASWEAMFRDPQYADALAKIDWQSLGTVSNQLGPELAKLVAAMQKEGAEMPMDLIIKVQKLNMQLVEQVPAILESGLPGFGPNGAYTHPLVVSNTLASSLQAAGKPLTAAQQQSIDGLVRSFSAETKAIADASREFDLEQLLAEVDVKDRFFREVGTLLQPDQHGVIYPEGSGTHDGSSLFSSGVVTHVYKQPIPAKDAAEFASAASRKLADQLGLDDAAKEQVRAVLARSAAAPELWRDRGDPAEASLQMMKTGRTQAALRQQIGWMREIKQQVALTPEQWQKLSSMKGVLVPVPR